MTVTICVGEAVLYVVWILWSSYTLHGQLEEQSYRWGHYFCDYHLFSSSFVVMIGEEKNPSKLLFETMMVLEKELPTQSHQALRRNVQSFLSSLRPQIHWSVVYLH